MKKPSAFKIPVKAPDPADAWVSDRRETQETPQPIVEPAAPETAAELMKRFTIDVPASLHTRVKIGCAMRGLKMADVLREMLEKEFPA
ncbi:MAG: hypothetical protein ACRYGP_08220 [Janthinobacterium lividum]